ncbi:beta-1,6-N-acetylglucosaminyltransferase [Modestobacter excelsi]|uniref:beta-1,6-N-acetylglucosaminyltransferase n=1 Tax=Modestobacter excelsi TaxID=2213161 RepID=UPI001C20E570
MFADLPSVTVLPAGVRVTWGDFSQVVALLELFRAARAVPADWYVLLSGEDYPVRPPEDLPTFLAATGADALLEETRTEDRQQTRGDHGRSLYRFQYAAVPLLDALTARLGIREAVLRRAPALARRLGVVSVRPRARGLATLVGFRAPWHPFRHGLEPERSRNWFALDDRALAALLDRLDRDPGLLRWYRRTLVPTEGLFATVLRHTPGLTVHDGDLHWERWQGDAASPAELGLDDLPAAVTSGAFFARKITDAAVLDRLDALVGPRATG